MVGVCLCVWGGGVILSKRWWITTIHIVVPKTHFSFSNRFALIPVFFKLLVIPLVFYFYSHFQCKMYYIPFLSANNLDNCQVHIPKENKNILTAFHYHTVQSLLSILKIVQMWLLQKSGKWTFSCLVCMWNREAGSGTEWYEKIYALITS